ncbi:MAG TPA: hypothetical protein VH120_11720, partial [Gemmataceae bacterium]|nr:hypothetical protein [Gemmataceae bacterium]
GIVLAFAGSALALLAKHVPAFYERTTLPPGDDRDAFARDFYVRSTELFNKVGGDRPWEQQFTQEQLNGYFQAQDAATELPAPLVEIPDDVKDIHVAFENDVIRIGFRYGEGDWSCIVSVEFRVWLVAKKTNMIALELCDFRAGALPLGTRTLIDYITEAARRQNIDVTWFRRSGHPIALLQLQANQPRPTFQLRRLEVTPGKFVVASSPTREPAAPPPIAAAPRPTEPATALPAR